MNKTASSQRVAVLIFGDLIGYLFSLILTLIIRYDSIPDRTLLFSHLSAFSILFVFFIIVGVSVGMYDKQSSFIRGRGWGRILQMEVINAVIGVIFFYFAPVAIAPKANLFIFFGVSTLITLMWRLVVFPVIASTKRQPALILGSGADIDDLFREIHADSRYGLSLKEKIAPDASPEKTAAAIKAAVEATKASLIVADLRNPAVEAAMPFLYSLIFSGIQILDASSMYESVFDRIPLSLVGERWLVENSSTALGTRRIYDTVKRTVDIVLALILGLVSLILYPILWAIIKLDDRGPLFVVQKRVGVKGKPIEIVKFRSMTSDDSGVYDANGKSAQKITRVGRFIRLTRIDELPQLWSVLKGDQSLIGPRPELPALTQIYEKELSYYNARHLIKPGLSGWAQIYHRTHPHHAVAISDTRDKLSYDLFYVKNRSLLLDIKIALQTLRALISRQGV